MKCIQKHKSAFYIEKNNVSEREIKYFFKCATYLYAEVNKNAQNI